jgi:hypothetical protein
LLASFVNHYVPLSSEQLTELDRRLEYNQNTEVRRMTTVFHERGRVVEARRMLQRVLEARYGELPEYVTAGISAEPDVTRLEDLAVRAVTCESLEEFERALTEKV